MSESPITSTIEAKSKLDNYGKPRQEYIDRLSAMSEEDLRRACRDFIWFSAYAFNNPKSDFHWKCDACYDECEKRGRMDIYNEEHSKLMRGA